MKLNKFSSIEQLRSVVKDVTSDTQFQGLDDNGEPVFDASVKLPTLEFQGRVKIHGTNASFGYDGENYWMQSRNDILNVKNNNAGFYTFGMNVKEYMLPILDKIYHEHDFDDIMVYGEFCGKGIQKGVAVSELDKRFVVFDVMGIYHTDDGHKKVFLNQYINLFDSKENFVFNIDMFDQYVVSIDFNNPEKSIDEIENIVKNVEKECPVGKKFGVEGIGEGVVFTHDVSNEKRYRFKAKGEKHSVTKVKKVVQIDVEKLNSIKEFVEYAVTKNRVLQATQSIGVEQSSLSEKNTGSIIKWTMIDIMKEESDTLIENNLTGKDITKEANIRICQLYFELLKEF